MGWITGIVGSGAGLIIIGVTFIASVHMGRVPAMAQKILRRLFIVAMYAGGSALAVNGLGSLGVRLVTAISGLFGGIDSGPARVVIILTGAFMLLGVTVALVFDPLEAFILLAAFLPFVLMLAPGGFLHQVYVATTFPAQQLADSFNAWIGG
jgi:hypothetical protein